PNWLFDIDTLTNSMNYVLVVIAGTSSTNILAHMESFNNDAQDACNADAPKSSGISNPTATSKSPPAKQIESLIMEYVIPTVSSPILTACLDNSPKTSSDTRLISKGVTSKKETLSLDNILTLSTRSEDILGDTTNTVDTNGAKANLSNMETSIPASPTPTFRIHKDHPKSQIKCPVDTPVQTRHKSKEIEEHSFIATIHQKTTSDLLQFCLFLCFLSQEEPKKIFDAPKDPSWVEAVIEAIRLFLAYASFMGFTVYQMDVKSAFLYGTINEEVYVMQPLGFQDPEFPDRVYKVEKAMYGLHQAPRAWYGTLFKYLLANGFQKGTIDQTLFIRKLKGDFLLVQVYVDDILFGSSNQQLCKEFEALMHEKFQMSDMDIMFAVCACARHQVTPKECHIHANKRIFRYIKGHPKLGLLYPKESPFELMAYSDSDYGGATQDRKSTTRGKSTTGGCQFLGRRLISWQCKKQTIVATFTIEAEYVAAASGYGQVLWIQNQMLDYGYNFMNTKIYIDNNSAIYLLLIIEVQFIPLGIFPSGEGLAIPTEPHHTPSPREQQSSHHDTSSSSHPIASTKLIPTATPTEIPSLRQYSRRATWIAQSKALSTAAEEHASFLRDDSQGEAFPIVTTLDTGQDRENIIKTSALPYESTPRARIKLLEHKDRRNAEPTGDDAPTKGRTANILTSRVAAVSVPPVAGVSTVGVPTVRLLGHPFDIDLMPIELGSFDVMVSMNWLAKYHGVIVCDEKIVYIPYGDEVLIIEGDGYNSGSKSKLSIISCTKSQKYIQKGFHVYLAQVTANKTDDKSEEKRLEDLSIIRDFLEVFPEDLLGLPPT
nr:hypothetical protein [Tanacetum cinerariifolium]